MIVSASVIRMLRSLHLDGYLLSIQASLFLVLKKTGFSGRAVLPFSIFGAHLLLGNRWNGECKREGWIAREVCECVVWKHKGWGEFEWWERVNQQALAEDCSMHAGV